MEASKTIEKPAKKTYQKHKQEGKISVVHYVNQKLKSKKNRLNVYPIYIRITVKRQTTNIRSLLSILELSIDQFNNINETDFLNDIKNIEISLIKKFIKEVNAFERNDFNLREISLVHHSFCYSVAQFFSGRQKKEILKFIDTYVSMLGIKEEFYRLFSFNPTIGSVDFENFIEHRRDTIISILNKISPDFKIISQNDNELLYHSIKILETSYGEVLERNWI